MSTETSTRPLLKSPAVSTSYIRSCYKELRWKSAARPFPPRLQRVAMPYKKILVALAGEADEHRVIEEALRLSTTLGAELAALHVNEPGAGALSMMMDAAPRVTEEDIRAQFRNRGYEQEADAIDVQVRTGPSLPKEIAAATQDADLLILGHRQKNRFLAALTDAADKHLTDLVSCPVLIVPR